MKEWAVRIGALTIAVLLTVAAPGRADDVSLTGSFVQGGLVEGVAPKGAKVAIDGKPVRVGDDGRFLVGFGRDAKPAMTLTVETPAGTSTRALKIERRAFQVSRVDGLPEKMVTPDKEALERIGKDRDMIAAARKRDLAPALYAAGFRWPATGRISGVYGSQRILNGKPRSPHLGVDIAAPVGTAVVAMTDGVVTLAEPDMFFTGRTVILDHGHGLTSVYAHLSDLIVKAGQSVKKGDAIGRIGASGRVTGPHLHWGVHLFGVGLDPALLVGEMQKPPEGSGRNR